MDSRISTIDKITILYRTGIKFLRGGYAESFLKNRMRYIGCSGKITIGKNVMFGPKCSLFAENHVFSDTECSIKSQGVQQKGITVEDDCWIGSNVTILDGVTIGKGSVIGAGTLVTKDIPAGSIVVDKREKSIRNR